MSAENEDLIEEIRVLSKKIDVLTIVTAADFLQGKSPTEQIAILFDLGLESNEVASILRKPSNYISSIKSRLSKKPPKDKLKEEKANSEA
jgi:hypothetical protein